MKEYKYKINGNDYNVTINNMGETSATVEVNGASYTVEWEKKAPVAAPAPTPKPAAAPTPAAAPAAKPTAAPAPAPAPAASAGGHAVKTPLPGVIVDVKVKVGDTVKRGQTLVVLEAMKMENNINSDRDGKVAEIKVSKGQSVLENTELVTLE